MADTNGTDGTGTSNGRSSIGGSGAFGPNAWLVEDMYDRFRADPTSVSDSWREFFTDYRPVTGAPTGQVPSVTATAVAPAPAPAQPKEAPTQNGAATGGGTPETSTSSDEPAVPLRGAAGRIVVNMEASLGVPTATSVRSVPAKLLEVNRTVMNNQLSRTMGGKVSFTHLIGYAVIKGLQAVPSMNAAFVADADGKGTPGVIRHARVGLGLAVDVEKRDGRTLLVPCIRDADLLDFRAFVGAYEDLVRKVHSNKIAPDDFAGTTVTLTNPGTLGTVQSVPRLMPGQGVIVGVGALWVPAGFEAADPRALADLGVGKTVTLTSTYDHRIIQGAESGLFLAYVAECLLGQHNFYDEVFTALEIPYEPVRWHRDTNHNDGADAIQDRLIKQ
ncbi:MAG TPA: 2-oxo acid dehydrogenase subunit E2, partial [Acidimicrobiales bacterium]|nr:2-oxo acid dehydrogenase subunit E2 [Acidimicrobiales bacterium]